MMVSHWTAGLSRMVCAEPDQKGSKCSVLASVPIKGWLKTQKSSNWLFYLTFPITAYILRHFFSSGITLDCHCSHCGRLHCKFKSGPTLSGIPLSLKLLIKLCTTAFILGFLSNTSFLSHDLRVHCFSPKSMDNHQRENPNIQNFNKFLLENFSK